MAKKDRQTRNSNRLWQSLKVWSSSWNRVIFTLEDSLAAFEKGVGLVKYCNQKLSEVEKKVELLIKDKDGRLQLKLLDSLADQEEKDEEGD